MKWIRKSNCSVVENQLKTPGHFHFDCCVEFEEVSLRNLFQADNTCTFLDSTEKIGNACDKLCTEANGREVDNVSIEPVVRKHIALVYLDWSVTYL